MAIVQISRITHRKGLQENLPQLDGGELGWSTDSQRLFIGNGTTEEPPAGDGAPAVGNTEILTEHSDIFDIIGNYTYKGQEAGYTVQTGASANNAVERSLQNKLDDRASVRDFGAVGDGQTDDTAAINRAFFQLFCRSATELSRRSLFFPAGEYLVSSTILIPPYARVCGEGIDSTTIKYAPTEWSETESYTSGQGVIKSTLSNQGRYEAIQDVPAGTAVDNTSYWKSVDGYVVRTSDNDQEVGANNGIFGRTSSRYNIIDGMTFRSTQPLSNDFPVTIALVGSARDCTFRNCAFRGPATSTSELGVISETEAAPAIDELFPETNGFQITSPLRGDSSTLITRGIILDSCLFSGQSRGVYAQDDVEGITVQNSTFETLFEGVHLNKAAGTIGPTGFRAVQNRFDNIYSNGLIFDESERNISGYNIFENVGNAGNIPNYKQSIVVITDRNNLSIGDVFLRTDAEALEAPRIDLGDAESLAIEMAERISLGSYNRDVGHTETLNNNTSAATTIITKDAYPTVGDPEQSVLRAFKMTYTIYRGTSVRTGVLTVVGSVSDASSSTLTFEDDYHENSDTGITLSVDQTGENVSVQYTSTNTGENAIIRFSIQYMTAAGIPSA